MFKLNIPKLHTRLFYKSFVKKGYLGSTPGYFVDSLSEARFVISYLIKLSFKLHMSCKGLNRLLVPRPRNTPIDYSSKSLDLQPTFFAKSPVIAVGKKGFHDGSSWHKYFISI